MWPEEGKVNFELVVGAALQEVQPHSPEVAFESGVCVLRQHCGASSHQAVQQWHPDLQQAHVHVWL